MFGRRKKALRLAQDRLAEMAALHNRGRDEARLITEALSDPERIIRACDACGEMVRPLLVNRRDPEWVPASLWTDGTGSLHCTTSGGPHIWSKPLSCGLSG